MSVLGLIVKENRKSLQPPAAASHSQAKNINTTPFCEHHLSCWPNLLQSVLGHVFGSLYFKRIQTTFPLPEIYYCWCCRREESVVRTAFCLTPGCRPKQNNPKGFSRTQKFLIPVPQCRQNKTLLR